MSATAPEGSEAHALKCELASEVLKSSGRIHLQVTGWSMLPTVWPGDTLTIERSEMREVQEGDIVLFSRDRRFCVHRVVKKMRGNLAILTRGDAMPRSDAPVSDRDLLGKVVQIRRNSKCLKPHKSFGRVKRMLGMLVGSSMIAARVVVGVHGMRQPAPQ